MIFPDGQNFVTLANELAGARSALEDARSKGSSAVGRILDVATGSEQSAATVFAGRWDEVAPELIGMARCAGEASM